MTRSRGYSGAARSGSGGSPGSSTACVNLSFGSGSGSAAAAGGTQAAAAAARKPALPARAYMDKAVDALNADPEDRRQPQRRRGVSFRDEYRALKTGAPGRGRAPSMIHEPTKEHMIPPQRKELRGKLTVVLDLDETLVYAREGPLFARPHLDLLFALLRDHCETVVWTAGVKAYAQTIIRNIDPTSTIEHCIYRHKKWFSGRAGYQKDLHMLGRDMDRVLIVENTPDCVRGNPQNGVLVSDYVASEGGAAAVATDPTIPTLTHFLACLIDSGLSVPEFLSKTNMLSTTSMPTDLGDSYLVYTLNSSQLAVTGVGRVNRDLLSIDTSIASDDDAAAAAAAGATTTAAAAAAAAPATSPEQAAAGVTGGPGGSAGGATTSNSAGGGGAGAAAKGKPGVLSGLADYMKNAVPLNVPLSPGGSFHDDWINCVAI